MHSFPVPVCWSEHRQVASKNFGWVVDVERIVSSDVPGDRPASSPTRLCCRDKTTKNVHKNWAGRKQLKAPLG